MALGVEGADAAVAACGDAGLGDRERDAAEKNEPTGAGVSYVERGPGISAPFVGTPPTTPANDSRLAGAAPAVELRPKTTTNTTADTTAPARLALITDVSLGDAGYRAVFVAIPWNTFITTLLELTLVWIIQIVPGCSRANTRLKVLPLLNVSVPRQAASGGTRSDTV